MPRREVLQRMQVTRNARVVNPLKPEWGPGIVLAVDGTRATAFFLRGGKRILDTTIPTLIPLLKYEGKHPALELAGQVDWDNAHENLYVIELRPEVFNERKFLEANRGDVPGVRACVYVGMTGLTPEDRLKAHLSGTHSARFVRKYGLRLLPDLYKHFNPMPYVLAQRMEVELASQLRAEGYGVWQN